ncbi:alpha/beta hydrolase [Spongiimicrobium salis]|uniref:alpha/beta hydrolase n=1 Tax=Spongiimicrobium salis TaxID=1667022 RepID=UPI00374CACDD
MKHLKYRKKRNTIQKIGTALMLLAGVMTFLHLIDVLPWDYYTTHDLRNYMFLAGALLYLVPGCLRKGRTKMAIVVFALFSSTSFFAQDYSKQIAAFTQSFSDKTTEAIAPHMSPNLQFGQIPVANTPAIMKNIVQNLPKLNSMSILESEEGKAKVAYDFVGLGKRESHIHFDAKGKITRIELVENLIQQEAEARRQQQQSVQLPTPGELGKKYTPTHITFKAADGLTISGNLYEIDKKKPVILLMHQAGYNRIEYADIAPKLNELGYNCLAVDLRSGGSFAGKPNKTNAKAIEKGEQPEMIDAQQDVAAAINYLNQEYDQNIIVWGSSFSSSLALLEGFDNPKVGAIIAFSPGDYFGNAAPSLATVFSQIQKPYWVTSSKQEATGLKGLLGASKLKTNQSQFIPASAGFHGSRALWEGQEGAGEYWTAVTGFLKQLK